MLGYDDAQLLVNPEIGIDFLEIWRIDLNHFDRRPAYACCSVFQILNISEKYLTYSKQLINFEVEDTKSISKKKVSILSLQLLQVDTNLIKLFDKS